MTRRPHSTAQPPGAEGTVPPERWSCYPTQDLLWLATQADASLVEAFKLGSLQEELRAELERRRRSRQH
jgi:hypothetical protein